MTTVLVIFFAVPPLTAVSSDPLGVRCWSQVALDAGRRVPVPLLSHASYRGFMMWQFAQARGSLET
jgi:hypothetical protein